MCPPIAQGRESLRACRHLSLRAHIRSSAAFPAGFPTSPIPIVPSSFRVVCFLPHSNRGGRRSCESSRSGSSAGTMRSRCAGRRRGGEQSTSRYSWDQGAPLMPQGELQHQLSPGCGSSSLTTAQFKQVFILSQATILTYSRSQMHSLGKAHSFNLASYPGQSPLTHLDLWILPTLGIFFEGSTKA